MSGKIYTISQRVLIHKNEDAKKLPQHIASLSATLGALAVGTVLSWTSSAGTGGKLLQDVYEIQISDTEFSLIGSLSALGAGAACIPTGILTNFIGRKLLMLSTIIPFTVGWLLIIFANSVLMLYFGRFIAGISVGAFCVVAPMYTAEIAEAKIRGSLGSYFVLLLNVGILLSYVLGSVVHIRVLSILSAIAPFIFFGVFVFMPESPIYYVQKGDEDSARKSLIKLRGSQYNVENELQEQRETLEQHAKMAATFFVVLKSRATVRAFIISWGLMFFQQLSGMNAIVFYITIIFEQTGSALSPSTSTIIVGVTQIVSVLISSLTVDHLGRKMLLIGSAIFMCLSTFALGLYFFLSHDGHDVSAIEWLPLLSVCVFIVAFSLGFGPVPWMMLGEIFALKVKGVAASSAALLNWLLVFFVTKFYNDLVIAIGNCPTFLLFSIISGMGGFFVYFLVPETKGKSLVDIQKDLENSLVYYIQKGDEDSARKSLIKLRGSQYNVENDLQEQREALEQHAKMATFFFVVLKSRATVKAFIISYGLMFFQQLSGLNIIIFYATSIFEQTGSAMNPNMSTIIVGAIQIVAILISSLTVDHLGRRILLIGSAIFMYLSSFALGLYFYLLQGGYDVSSIKWLPLLSVCTFIALFNIGFGPLPWMMLGEIFALKVKGVAASSAALLNWLLVFFVTKFYNDLVIAIGNCPTFLLFSIISGMGGFFVYFLVPETKGKSLVDIQKDLENS
nr:PREDICTED: facilitated trehalose transporter Tret1-like [Megachile rotundata]